MSTDVYQFLYRLVFIDPKGKGYGTLIVGADTLELAISRGCSHIESLTGKRVTLTSVSRCFNTLEEQNDALMVLDKARGAA